MDKIIEAINSMVTNSKKITKVILGVASRNPEYFFLYDNKYKWSTMLTEDGGTKKYYLFFYHGDKTIEELASFNQWKAGDYITYKSQDFSSSEEATKAFHVLYSLVKNKLYKIDEALDEIIKGSS